MFPHSDSLTQSDKHSKAHGNQPVRTKNLPSTPKSSSLPCSVCKGRSWILIPLPSAAAGQHNPSADTGLGLCHWDWAVSWCCSPVPTQHYKHKAQGCTEQTFGQFIPNITLFFGMIFPNPDQTQPSETLAGLEDNVPFSIWVHTWRSRFS